jgi:hypothetical protein
MLTRTRSSLKKVDARVEIITKTEIRLTKREDFVREIGALWTDANEKFLLIGRYLNQAKAALLHGEYEVMVERDLPFGRAVAHKLRVVAAAIDNGVLPIEHLPPSYSTVYELITLNSDERQQALEQELIRPTVTRKEIMAFKSVVRAAAITADKLQQRLEHLRAERDRLDALRAKLDAEIRELEAQVAKKA